MNPPSLDILITGAGAILIVAVLVFSFKRARKGGGGTAPQSEFDKLIGKEPARRQTQRGTRDCRWVADHFRHDAASKRWVCDTCGVEVFQSGSAAPAECRRADARLKED